MRMGHVNSRTLVAYIDDLYSFRIETHPYGHDVSATKGKYPINTSRF
jgi:hypothetical protein